MAGRRRLRRLHGALEPALARRFVEWLGPSPAGHWLDVGSGTGALTEAIASVAAPASIVACDPSEAFVEYARAHSADARVAFSVAGADALPGRDGGFDYVVSGLVLNFVPDVARAVAALGERTRAGGTVSAYVWDYAEGMEFLRCFWDEAAALDPGAASLDEGRRFPLCRRDALEALFTAARFARVETAELVVPTEFASFDDYWAPFLRGTGPAPSYVAALDEPRRQALRSRLVQRLASGSDERLRLRARAWAVRGVRSDAGEGA